MVTTIPTPPIRTPAGEDELRRRTRKLGQRHRTVLLLTDGKRGLDELLTLAQQAGAAVSHFEELVQLGLVELPAPPPEPVPAPEAPAEAASSADVETTPVTPEENELDMAPTVPMAELPPLPEPVAAARGPTPQTSAPGVNLEVDPETQQTPEESQLQQVRDLLIDTLRIDSPLFGARTFFRVRSAQSASELIDLVWEIEEHLAHARHSREDLISLQRARELLGMGNTRVAGETHPGMLPE